MKLFSRAFLGSLLVGAAPLAATEFEIVLLPPPNDHFTNALEIAGDQFVLSADLGAATREAFEPYPSGGDHGQTAWWSWVAPQAGIMQWTSEESPNTVAVAVFRRDALGQLKPVARTYRRPVTSGWLAPDSNGSFHAETGVRYFIQLDLSGDDWLRGGMEIIPIGFPGGPPPEPRPVRVFFSRSLEMAPANDRFSDRVLLPGTNAVFEAGLSGATGELEEPRVSEEALSRTRWWTWVAPDYGTARIHATNEMPVVNIFKQGVLHSLDLLASSATRFGNPCHSYAATRAWLQWDTVPGGRYEIQVDRFPHLLLQDPTMLELGFVFAPANDEPEHAEIITGRDLSLTASTLASTLRPGELKIPTQSGSNSVWYRWTAPASGIVEVTRSEPLRYDDPSHEPGYNSGEGLIIISPSHPCRGAMVDLNPPPPFVPVFGLFYRSVTSDAPANRPNIFVTYGTNGFIAEIQAREYWIALDGDRGSSGETPMNLLLIPPPANDHFTNRIVLPSSPVKVTGRTFAATRDASDPLYVEGGQTLRRIVWWEWRAPAAGLCSLVVSRGNNENHFKIFRGQAPLVGNETAGTLHEPVTFMADEGEVFQIGVFARAGFGGNIQFTISSLEPPLIGAMQLEGDRPQRQARLRLMENAGLPYVIESSPDLVTWTPAFTNTQAWPHWIFVPANRKSAEFFRTVLPPEESLP
jgi:hypothetical protein